MSKYIKLEDAEKRLADILYEEPPYIDSDVEIMRYAKEQMEDLPSIDIVHCKDCKKRNTRTCMMNNNVGMNKDLFDDDYCSYGEKQVTSKLGSEKVQLSQETPTNSKTETVDTSTCNLATNLQHDCKLDTDLISRQGVIAAIEGTDWYHINKNGEMVSGALSEHGAWYKHDDIMRILETIPSPPVEPKPVCEDIVKCKDCKWRDEAGCALLIVDASDKPKDDDFCSYGERKEQEDE